MNLRYRPFTSRQQFLIVLLAITTAVGVALLLTEQPGAPPRTQAPRVAGPAECTKGQSTRCVGGKLDVIIVAPPAASAGAL